MEAETDKTIVHFNKRYILLVLIKRKEKKDEKKLKKIRHNISLILVHEQNPVPGLHLCSSFIKTVSTN